VTAARLSPFDFIKSINEKSENLIAVSPDAERDYIPFVVNRGLSFSSDTVLYANEMNCIPFADKRMQYDYLYYAVRRRKRFDKWMKPEQGDEELIQATMNRYGVNRRRATEYISLMSPEARQAVLNGKGGVTEPK
jgi:hypothetical protein